MKSAIRVLIVLLAMTAAAAPLPQVKVHGLFKGRAMVSIDGVNEVLKLGETRQGITLTRADSEIAIIEFDGKEYELTLSREIGGEFQPVSEGTVSISLNPRGQYLTTGNINGVPVTLLVDTGATIVAMNAAAARRLGIQFESNVPGEAVTAGGRVRSWSVVLDQVQVGAIKRYNVRAAVLEGSFPVEILLGMTFLSQVQISEADGVMILTSKF